MSEDKFRRAREKKRERDERGESERARGPKKKNKAITMPQIHYIRSVVTFASQLNVVSEATQFYPVSASESFSDLAKNAIKAPANLYNFLLFPST